MLLAEEGSPRARSLWEIGAPVVTSWLAFAETGAAISAARRARRVSPAGATASLRWLEAEWDSLDVLDADGPVCRAASVLAGRHRLRGADAVHLASALLLAPAAPVLVSWDVALRRAARAEGLAVAVV